MTDVAGMRELAAGIGFTEGPVWLGDGRVLVTSISRGLLYEVALDGGFARAVATTGGGPNGLARHGTGDIWIAQNGGRVIATRSTRPVRPGLQRWRTGEADVDDVLTEGFSAPNDCVVAPDGRLWFTDPHGSAADPAPQPGRVWAYDLTTGAVEVLLDGIMHPNGLAFGIEPNRFFLAETIRARVLRYRVTDGGLRAEGVFCELEEGEPDGLAVDAEGRLLVAATHANAVLVYDPDGTMVERIDLGPSFPTNLCFAGEDLDVLVITAPKGGRVLALPRAVPGLAL